MRLTSVPSLIMGHMFAHTHADKPVHMCVCEVAFEWCRICI